MRAVEALFVLGLAGIGAWLCVMGVRALVARASGYRRAHEPWEVGKHPTEDGGWEVTLERPGERRVVQTLPAAPSLELQSDLVLALDDAEREAKILNRR